MKNGSTLLRFANVIALAVTIVVNALANTLPINGQTTGEVSDQFQSYIVPAGFTFSIWSVIYFALAAFVVAQALPGWLDRPLFRRVGWLFVLTCVANTAWVLLWHYEFYAATLAVMITLLATLLAIYTRFDADRASASTRERWLAAVPFSIYLGWITIATIANATVVLLAAGWNGGGIAPDVWAAILLVVATGIVGAISLTRGDVGYAAVALWAFAGVFARQSASPVVAWTAVLAIAFTLIAIALGWWRRTPGRPLTTSPA